MRNRIKRLLAAAALVMMLCPFALPAYASGGDEWFIGTWCASDWDSGAAVKLEPYGEPGCVIVSQIMISTQSKGSVMTKLRGYYRADYETAPDGSYILIPPSLPGPDGKYFSGIKLFRPEGDPNRLKVVLAPVELTGDAGAEGPATWYRRDSGAQSAGTPESSGNGSGSSGSGSGNAEPAPTDSSGAEKRSSGKTAVVAVAAAAVTAGVAGGAAIALKGAGKNMSGGKVKTGGGNGDDGVYVLKDPATGAESLYIYDDTSGEWVSDDGGSVLDTSKIAGWQEDRAFDRKAADDTMKKLRTRGTETDRRLDQILQEEREERLSEKRRDYFNEIGQRHSIYSGDESAIKKALSADQKTAEKLSEKAHTAANRINQAVTAAEVAGKAADLGMDAIGTYAKPLKPATYLYYGGRNLASNLSDAIVNNKDTWSAVRKAVGETAVDIAQSSVDKLGYKFLANTAGDAYKKVLTAIDEGKISAEELGSAAGSGVVSGFAKTGVSTVFKKLETEFKPTAKIVVKTGETVKNLTKEASRASTNLLSAYQGGSISSSTYEGAKSVLRAKYVAEVRQVEQWADTYVKTVEKAAEAAGRQYDTVSNVLENMTNDLVTGNDPFKWN